MIDQEDQKKDNEEEQSKINDQTNEQMNFQSMSQRYFDKFQSRYGGQLSNRHSDEERPITRGFKNEKNLQDLLEDTLGYSKSIDIQSRLQSPLSFNLNINLEAPNSQEDSINKNDYDNQQMVRKKKIQSFTPRVRQVSSPQHSSSLVSTPQSKRRNNALNLDNQLNSLLTNYSKKVHPYDKLNLAIQQKKKRDSFSMQLKNEDKQAEDSEAEEKQKNQEEQSQGESEQQIRSCHILQQISNELSNSVQNFQTSNRSSFRLNLPQQSGFRDSKISQSKQSPPTSKKNLNEQSPKFKSKGSLTKVNNFINTFNFTSAIDVSVNNMNSSQYKLTNLLSQSFYQNTPNNNSNIKSQVSGNAPPTKFSNFIKSYSNQQNWRTALNIIKVNQFKKKLLQQIQFKLNHALNQNQLNLLDDKSYFIEKKQYRFLKLRVLNRCSLFLEKLIQLLFQIGAYISQFQAIQPNSLTLIIWKSFYIIISFLSFYYYSLQGAFGISLTDMEDSYNWMSIFFMIFNIIFAIDMLIDLNTGYYFEGVVQHSRINILKNCIVFDFWIHLLKLFLQFSYIEYGKNTVNSYLLCFLHLYSMSKNSQPLDQHWQIQQKHPIIRLVILLLIVILTVAHLSGCFFYSLSQVQSNYYIADSKGGQQGMCNNWVSCSNLDEQDWIIKYIFSLYFSFITMITVGYGDIFPVSVFEKIYVIGMTCITCGIFGYAINKISSVINELAQKQYSQKQEQYEIINYMDNRQISQSTQIKVLKYIEHVQEKEKENPINGQLILKKISKTLKKKVQEEYFGTILKKCQLFTATFSQTFLDELMAYMNEALYSPDEVIYNSNETSENTLYFLVDGNIGLFQHNNSNQTKMVQSISKKQFIGLTNFFSQQKEENTVYKTIETSLIVSLQYKDFLSCLQSYPNDLEKFHNIKQEILENQGRLEACQNCGQFGHAIQKCSLIHLTLNKQLIKMKYQFSQSQINRDPSKKRNREFRVNTYAINRQIKKDIRLLRSNLVLESRGHEQVSTPFETDDINYESDRQFFIRVAQVSISQNIIKTIQDLNDTCIDSSNSISYSSSDNSFQDVNNCADRVKDNSLIEELDEEDQKDNLSRSSIVEQKQKKQSLQQNSDMSNNGMQVKENFNDQISYSQGKQRDSIQQFQPISQEFIYDDSQSIKKSENFSIASYSYIKNYQPKETSPDKQSIIKIPPRHSLLDIQKEKIKVSSYSQINNPTQNAKQNQLFNHSQNQIPDISNRQQKIPQSSQLIIPQNNLLQIPQYNQFQSQFGSQSRIRSDSMQRSSLSQYSQSNYQGQKQLIQNQIEKSPKNLSQFQNSISKYNNSKIFDEDLEFDTNEKRVKKKKQSIKDQNVQRKGSKPQINEVDNDQKQKQMGSSQMKQSKRNQVNSQNNRFKAIETEMKTTLPTYQDDFNQLDQIFTRDQKENQDNSRDQSFFKENYKTDENEEHLIQNQLNILKQDSLGSRLKQQDKHNRDSLKRLYDDKKYQVNFAEQDGKGNQKKEILMANKEKRSNYMTQIKIRQSIKIDDEQNYNYGVSSNIFKSQNEDNTPIQNRDSFNSNQLNIKPIPQTLTNSLNTANVSNIPNLNRNSSIMSNNLLSNIMQIASNNTNNPNQPQNNYNNKKLNSLVFDEQANQINQINNRSQLHQQNEYPEFSSPTNNQEELFIFDFEVGKEWVYFQPHHNLQMVIKEHKKYLRLANMKNRNGKEKMKTITRQVLKKKKVVRLLQDFKTMHEQKN